MTAGAGADPLTAIGVRPLGGREGTGRAVVVTLRRAPAAVPDIVDRVEIELVPAQLPGRVFHAAADLTPDEAAALVREVEHAAAAAAKASLAAQLAAARQLGRPVGVALVVDERAPEPPESLATILASHSLLHAAETALYRDVLMDAAANVGVPVIHQPLHRLEAVVPAADGLGIDEVAGTLATWGRAVGRPWRKEHKQAALAAWGICR